MGRNIVFLKSGELLWPRILLKLIVMVLFFLTCSPKPSIGSDEAVNPPAIWRLKQAAPDAKCISLTGEYEMQGEVAPQTPSNFRGWLPLSLEVMAGVHVTSDNRKQVTHVRVDHKGATEIELTFFSKERVVLQHTIVPAERINILCESDRVTVKKSVETKGEATSGTADIVDTYFLADDGSLIINKIIKRVEDVLIFFKKPVKEEYWVKFRAISSQ